MLRPLICALEPTTSNAIFAEMPETRPSRLRVAAFGSHRKPGRMAAPFSIRRRVIMGPVAFGKVAG